MTSLKEFQAKFTIGIKNCHDGVVSKLRTLRIADTFVVKVSRFCVINSHGICKEKILLTH